MNKVAIVLTSYNMPERTNALAEHIYKHFNREMYDLIVVDNGSDLCKPSKYTTVQLLANRQTCGGWLAGLDYADFMEKHGLTKGYFAYMIMITSTEFVDGFGDILSPMLGFLEQKDNAVMVHPALTSDSTTAWKQLYARTTNPKGAIPRRTWMVDNICCLYRADWFNKIGRFDPFLTYAFGADLEPCYLARKEGRGIFVDERVRVKKVTDIGYTMNRMNETALDRRIHAYAEANEVLTNKYGEKWEKILRDRYVLDEWR